MADPVSVAGTAVGVVSLGLTVCHGLIKYYSAFKSRETSVEATLTYVEGLASTLGLLNSRLRNVPPGFADIIKDFEGKVTACGSRIAKLEAYLTKIQEHEAEENWKDKLRAQKSKLLYPFRQDSLEELTQLVRDTQNSVDTALSLFNL